MSAQAAPRTARRTRTRWAIAALATVAVIVAGVLLAPRIMGLGAGEAVSVATTAVESGRLIVTASGDGETEAIETYDGYPEVSGTVEEIKVSVGDRVKAGQVLYTLDDADLRKALTKASASVRQADQQVAQARQQVSQAKLQLTQARNRLDALESATGTHTASAGDVDEAEQSVAVAKDAVASAEAGLASAKAARATAVEERADAAADLEKTEVTAPAAGVITHINISEGGAVSAGGSGNGSASTSSAASALSGGATGSNGSSSGAPVVIADTSELKVTVVVNEVDIADVTVGQKASVTFDAVEGLEIPATVAWVSPNAEASGNVTGYSVELTLGKQDERLRAGMTASADIVTLSVDDALLLPKSSIKTQDTEKYVTVVGSDGTQQRRVVTTGPSDDTRVQVLTGLKAGERVASVTAAAVEQQGGMPRGAMMLGGSPPGGRPGGSRGAQGGDR